MTFACYTRLQSFVNGKKSCFLNKKQSQWIQNHDKPMTLDQLLVRAFLNHSMQSHDSIPSLESKTLNKTRPRTSHALTKPNLSSKHAIQNASTHNAVILSTTSSTREVDPILHTSNPFCSTKTRARSVALSHSLAKSAPSRPIYKHPRKTRALSFSPCKVDSKEEQTRLPFVNSNLFVRPHTTMSLPMQNQDSWISYNYRTESLRYRILQELKRFIECMHMKKSANIDSFHPYTRVIISHLHELDWTPFCSFWPVWDSQLQASHTIDLLCFKRSCIYLVEVF